MQIGILGSTGVIGRRLAPLLLAQGHHVRCLTRAAHEVPAGAEQWVADILEPAPLERALAGLDVVINLATSIPNGKGRGDWGVNDRIRIDGTRNVLETLCQSGGSCRLIQQSVAMLHQEGGRVANESGEVTGQGILTSAVAMEANVQRSPLDWVLLRGAAVYGPDTARDSTFFACIASGRLRPPEDSTRWISLVHIDDLAAAFAHAVTLPTRSTYIVSDDRPVTYDDLFSGFALSPPINDAPVLNALPSFRVSNQYLRATGWAPKHPDVFETMRASVQSTLQPTR